jgi:hypothetical protein
MCHWIHNFTDEPILLYSELNDQRYEVRKVELYADGRIGYSTQELEHGGTGLGLEPIPLTQYITKDAEFVAADIDRNAFEKVWNHFVLKN